MASNADGADNDLTNVRAEAETLSYSTNEAQARFGHAPANRRELTGVLGRYTILNRLGSGGMGTVYLAHDSQFDHQVALKAPHFTGTNDQTVVQRFHREAQAAIKLRHSNLCPVYDFGEINGQHYLAMAYIEGFPLTKLVDPRCPMPDPPSRLRPGLDPRIEEICLKAMSKNIGDRFASMRDFAVALATFANPSSAAGREANSSVTVTDVIYSADTEQESPLVDSASSRSTVGVFEGKAEEAMQFYVSLLANSRIPVLPSSGSVVFRC